MALMVCPECQKQVSDTVEVFPHCGYSIARHMKRCELENYISSKIDELNQEMEQELKEIDNLSEPKSPSISSNLSLLSFLLTVACAAQSYLESGSP